MQLKKATRDGDLNIYILTNLPRKAAGAKKVAELYRNRWTIETAFQELTEHLNSEINTLGYPPAALFGFCVALVAYITMAVLKAALGSVYGSKRIEQEFSGYYLADELAGTYRGMMIAVPSHHWLVFRTMAHAQFVALLLDLAQQVNMRRFRKHPRQPKKKTKPLKVQPNKSHVSTARMLATREN